MISGGLIKDLRSGMIISFCKQSLVVGGKGIHYFKLDFDVLRFFRDPAKGSIRHIKEFIPALGSDSGRLDREGPVKCELTGKGDAGVCVQ